MQGEGKESKAKASGSKIRGSGVATVTNATPATAYACYMRSGWTLNQAHGQGDFETMRTEDAWNAGRLLPAKH